MDQRINIKFLAKYGKNATETYEMLKHVYGDECLSRAQVFKWHKQFLEGRESVQNEERGAPLRTARNDEKIQQVREFIAQDRNAPVRMIAEAVGLSAGSVHKILTEDLQKKKFVRDSYRVQRTQQHSLRCDQLFGSQRSHSAQPPSVFS